MSNSYPIYRKKMPNPTIETSPLRKSKGTPAEDKPPPEHGGLSMLSCHRFNQVRVLKGENRSQSEIAEILGIDRKTVKKYLKSNSPPRYSPRASRTKEDPFAPYRTQVQGWLDADPDGQISAREIFEWIWQEGYRGSERTINRRVASLIGSRPKERFFEQEYVPGEQSQFDFKESVELPFPEGPRLVHLHFGTLPFSDWCFVRGYPFKTYECFMDGIHSFFEELGGMTEKIRIDNLSPCVSKVLKGGRRIYTQAFARAISYYDFKVLPCTPGKGNEKGDVERDIRTFAKRIKNLVKKLGVVFRDWDHLNLWLKDYMSTRMGENIERLLQEEKKKLNPLPRREDSILCKIEETSAGGFGTVRIKKTSYSVPDDAIGVYCRVVLGPYDVKISRLEGEKKQIALHPRKPEGEASILPEHVLPSLLRKPQALVRWAHRKILFPSQVFENFYTHIKKIDELGAEREFLRSINLIQFVPLSEIEAGMELVLENPSHHPFEDLRDLLLGERRPQRLVIPIEQTPLKPELSVYDELIPKSEEKKPA
jgi:transposase